MTTQPTPITPKDKLQLKKPQRISFRLGKRTATQELVFTGFNSEMTFANFERTTPIITEFFRYNKQDVIIAKETREVKTIVIPVKNILEVNP